MHTDQTSPAELARLASEIATYALGKSGPFYRYDALDAAACEAQGLPGGTVLVTPAPPVREAHHSLVGMYADDAHDLLVSANETLGAHQYLTVSIARGEPQGDTGLLAARGPWKGLHVNVLNYVQAQADLNAARLTRRIVEQRAVVTDSINRPGQGVRVAIRHDTDALIAWEAECQLWNRLANEGDIVRVLAEALHTASAEYCNIGDLGDRYVRTMEALGATEFLRRARTRPGYSADEALNAMLNRAAP